MDKKVVTIACAVLAFFAGAIWVDYAPVVAPLVAFLEVCAGFTCGFFFYKAKAAETTAAYLNEIESLKAAQRILKESLEATKVVEKPVAKKKSTKTEKK